MNTSPRRDIEGKRIIIANMVLQAVENELAKGQKSGDATKVIAGGEIEEMNEYTPRVEAKVEKHNVAYENGKCNRVLSDNSIMSIKKSKEDLDMKIATMKQETESSLEEDMEK